MKRPNLVKCSLFLLAGLLIFAAGCASVGTVATRKQERYAAYQALPPDLKAAVDMGQVKAGMSMDAVYIAWGPPTQIIAGGNAAGETITWVYQSSYLQESRVWGRRGIYYSYAPGGYVRAQVSFVNGLVRDWQTFAEPAYSN